MRKIPGAALQRFFLNSRILSPLALAASLCLATLGGNAFSAETKEKAGKSTDLRFDDLLVKGKHHFSDEAIVTVEQDKVLDSLLKVPKDFKNRVRRSASQQ